MQKNDAITLIIHDKNASQVKVELIGRLDIHSTPSIWEKCIALQKKYQPKTLTIMAGQLDYCDGAGIGLLQTLQRNQGQKNYIIEALPPQIQNLLDLVNQPSEKIYPSLPDDKSIDVRIRIGRFTIERVKEFYENITFIGMLCYQFLYAARHLKRIRWKTLWKAIEDTGPQALPIIALIGFLIGLISTFQSAPSFGEFGAQIYMIDLVGLGLVREMGPLMTAVLLAGRTASSFAAEIGTMKINEEIDALKTMGLEPIQFLAIPRILATIIVTPLLNIFLIFFGLIGCYLVMQTLGYPLDAFLNRLYTAIDLKDCIGGLIKVLVFGLIIASVGCLQGLKTKTDAKAVGYSTTHAVVNSLIMIVIADGIFASIYYVLGI